MSRQKLAKLGYRFSGDEISSEKADIFVVIADEIGRLNEKEAKGSSKRGNRS